MICSLSPNFNPRSPCGERPRLPTGTQTGLQISIHALLAESDESEPSTSYRSFDFNPRSPCGERLVAMCYHPFESFISIHALLAESDDCVVNGVTYNSISIHALLAESDHWLAYSRPPEGISIHALLAESDFPTRATGSSPTFQSTLSLRRATGGASADQDSG